MLNLLQWLQKLPEYFIVFLKLLSETLFTFSPIGVIAEKLQSSDANDLPDLWLIRRDAQTGGGSEGEG